MAEYIEREAAIKDICNRLSNEHGVYSVVKNLINHVPAADVAPVRHGRWEKNDDGIMIWWECSECHKAAWYDRGKLHDFCPDCGAKMGGK